MKELSSTGDQMLVLLDTVVRHGPLSVAEAARRCGINRTVAHRLLATLSKHNFVARLKEGYVLGARPLELAALARPSLITAAHPVMQGLADACRETVVLHGQAGSDAVVLDQVVHDDHLIVVRHMPGSRHPLHRGASGWAILAFLDDAAIDKLMPDANRPALLARIAQVRAAGFSLTTDELQQGVCGLAAPVFDARNHCVGSLAVIVPILRRDRLDGLKDAVLHAAADLSRQVQAQV